MKIKKSPKNILTHNEFGYSPLVLGKALGALILESHDVTSFALMYDSLNEEWSIEPNDMLDESTLQVAMVTGRLLYQEHPINRTKEFYLFETSFEEDYEEPEVWESILSVQVTKLDDYLEPDTDESEAEIVLEEAKKLLRENGYDVEKTENVEEEADVEN